MTRWQNIDETYLYTYTLSDKHRKINIWIITVQHGSALNCFKGDDQSHFNDISYDYYNNIKTITIMK